MNRVNHACVCKCNIFIMQKSLPSVILGKDLSLFQTQWFGNGCVAYFCTEGITLFPFKD